MINLIKLDRLSSVAYDLAMLALQSKRYQEDAEYKEATDRVIELTKGELKRRFNEFRQ